VFSHSTPAANHGHEPTAAMHGAPLNFYGIARRKVWYVDFPTALDAQSSGSDSDRDDGPVALGVANDVKAGYVRTAYAAYRIGRCRTLIERHHIGNAESSVSDPDTINGSAVATPMAVSPDGTKLALVTTAPLSARSEALGCAPLRSGSQQLVIINLRTHAVRRWSSSPNPGTLSSLQWSADSRHLAFFALYRPMVISRVQVLDTAAPGHDYELAKVVAMNPTSSSIFWWHGQLATIYRGSMHVVAGRDGVGKVLATGFPSEVDSISSDPTGNHLLLTSGGTTYRWDSGQLSAIKGQWTQPGW
jgi:hypothetical protein